MKNLKNLLEENNSIKFIQLGKIVEGKVIGRAKSAIFLDLGLLGTGTIFGKEFQDARSELRNLKIGDSISAKIIETENEDGYVELSLRQASSELNWDKISQAKENGELLTVKIIGANKGGLLANLFGISAFLPVSQLSLENYPKVEKGDTNKILQELQGFVGKEIKVKIFDFNQKQDKLILSEKIINDIKIKETLKNYTEGDLVDGEITGITDFGAFIKFSTKNTTSEDETIEGLIHISELDWQLIDNPSEIVKVGEKIQAKIVSITNNKIFLSLKALKKDPWENIEEKYKKDDIINAKVTKLNPFGAFIEITSKIQGLCHISEFGTREKMRQSLEVNKKYDFQILSIEPKEYRISLKLVEDKEKIKIDTQNSKEVKEINESEEKIDK